MSLFQFCLGVIAPAAILLAISLLFWRLLHRHPTVIDGRGSPRYSCAEPIVLPGAFPWRDAVPVLLAGVGLALFLGLGGAAHAASTISDPVPAGSLASLIGAIDVPAAAMLVALFGTICIIVTTSIAKRRSRRALDQDFELAKMKERNAQTALLDRQQKAHDRDREAALGAHRLEELKIGQGLITSHARDVSNRGGGDAEQEG